MVKIFRQRCVPPHALAGGRVVEPQAGSMKRQPSGAAVVRRRFAVQGAVVDTLATNRGAALTQMNANLMRATSLQPPLHESGISQFLQYPTMRDRAITWSRFGTTAPTSVATV